ncbi:MAG: hypothetical protein FJ292_02650 [Planctomycetes bacterium]|nr:hypothetical protein [Planctomycetota bacterium]
MCVCGMLPARGRRLSQPDVRMIRRVFVASCSDLSCFRVQAVSIFNEPSTTRGLVFTEFIQLVEEKFGVVMADDVLSTPGLTDGGAYTSVGQYPHTKMLAMVGTLAERSGTPASDLCNILGEFRRMAVSQAVAQLRVLREVAYRRLRVPLIAGRPDPCRGAQTLSTGGTSKRARHQDG